MLTTLNVLADNDFEDPFTITINKEPSQETITLPDNNQSTNTGFSFIPPANNILPEPTLPDNTQHNCIPNWGNRLVKEEIKIDDNDNNFNYSVGISPNIQTGNNDDPTNPSFFCGNLCDRFLISKDWIITATHCTNEMWKNHKN